uniref:Phospho2dehydro3deoxyheptonate aldolase putative n=1 Tax=Albugo laibachii Nc14 TaxID=890382 RepID=F0WVS2_9STRA|nr:phospho2dehydro3deoxyheptonate aldolase putative [Albugo laibachii Nc14]|eukprot:CCA25518.1 phospho2dehydro3deoxyheptonate aldolase putative [Albugo laibachii Nc14]
MPIGFNNGTGGSLELAVDTVVAARHPHCILSVSLQGLASIVNTTVRVWKFCSAAIPAWSMPFKRA